MMNINTYFNTILDTKGFDTWEETTTKVWEMYEADDGSFEAWAEAEDIDLSAVCSSEHSFDGELELNLWVWSCED
jgi:hypothetical protein